MLAAFPGIFLLITYNLENYKQGFTYKKIMVARKSDDQKYQS